MTETETKPRATSSGRHYSLHVETWRGLLHQASDYSRQVVYVIGAPRALDESKRLHAEATAAGLSCSIIRRDSRGRGRIFDAPRGRFF